MYTLFLTIPWYPQFDFKEPNYKISKTVKVVEDITSDIKNDLFYLDTTYRAAIEPLAYGNGVEVLFIVAGKGICVQIRGFAYKGEGALSFNIGIPRSFYNKTHGILGYFDGSKDTELYHRNDMNNPFQNPQNKHVNMSSCEFLNWYH